MTSKPNPEIQKIELTKEQQDEVNKILKGEPVESTYIYHSSRWGQTEHTINKILPPESAKKRLIELKGGVCCCCGNWPDYDVLYDMEGAKRIVRYCSPCFEKWKDRL